MTTPRSSVSIVQCSDYDREHVQDGVKRLLAPFGGMEGFVRPGQTVLLKPNMLVKASPERAVTTHPELVRAVALEVIAAGGNPVVGDSPGFESLEAVSSATGIASVLSDLGIPLVDFDADQHTTLPEARVARRVRIAQAVKEVDAIINLPKLKTHGLMTYTGCVKNMFGSVCGGDKAQTHFRFQDLSLFSEALLDIYAYTRPHLNIMDAITAMEGNGPRNGSPVSLGLILAGSDGVAVDAVACSIIGIDPMSLTQLRIAHERTIGIADLSAIDITGVSVCDAKAREFKVPRPSGHTFVGMGLKGRVGALLKHFATARPVLTHSKCSNCSVCVHVCPAKAVSSTAGRMGIDLEACIRCYCCQELCPHGAISITHPPFARLLSGLGRKRR